MLERCQLFEMNEKLLQDYNSFSCGDKACYEYRRSNGERLIVSYSEKRAKKDTYNRDRGVTRLRKAYKVYKELERIIKMSNINMSVGHVLDAAKTVTTIRVRMPENGQIYSKTLFLTDRHRIIQPLSELVNKQY